MNRNEALLQLRKQLQKRRRFLQSKLLHDVFLGSEAYVNGSDIGDTAWENESNSVLSHITTMESEELRLIEIALEKFDDGTYGLCEMSGQQIPIERLQALPFTRLCVECKQLLEERGNSDELSDSLWNDAHEQEAALLALQVMH